MKRPRLIVTKPDGGHGASFAMTGGSVRDKAVVCVTIDFGWGERDAVCKEIGSPFVESFEPVDACNDSFIAYVVGGKTPSAMRRVTKLRKDYAEIISKETTNALVELMSQRDTENGYKKAKL